MGNFVEIYRRIGLNVSVGKSKVMLLGWEKGLECEVCEARDTFRACLGL